MPSCGTLLACFPSLGKFTVRFPMFVICFKISGLYLSLRMHGGTVCSLPHLGMESWTVKTESSMPVGCSPFLSRNHLYCCSLLLIAALTFPWKLPRAAELDKLVPFLTNKKTIDILAVLNSLTVLARSPAFTEAASWACDCRLGKIKTA